MSNRTYICTECCTAKRAEAAYELVTPLRCVSCREPLWELSPKWRIPKKDDTKAWKELREMILRQAPERKERLLKRGGLLLQKVHEKMRQISQQKASDKNDLRMKRLLRERLNILRRYFASSAAEEGSLAALSLSSAEAQITC